MNNPYAHGYFNEIKIGDVTIGGSGGTGDAGKFLRGDGQWSNSFSGYIVIDTSSGFDPNIDYYTKSIVDGKDIYTLVTDTSGIPEEGVTYYTNKITIAFNNSDNDGTIYTENTNATVLNTSNVFNSAISYWIDSERTNPYTYSAESWETDWASLYVIGTVGTYTKNIDAAIYTIGGIAAEKNIWAAKVFNAVFNDYAECRKTAIVAPGYVVIDQDDGNMISSYKRL